MLFRSLDLFKLSKMTFYKPDYDAFPLLSLAKRAMALGGAMPAVLNAADEVAVDAFLREKLSFLGISEVVSETLEKLSYMADCTSLDKIILADQEARQVANKIIKERYFYAKTKNK